MTTDEIRKRYLEFFRRHEHRVVQSDSLLPAHDPSLLFTGSGMNQFKDEFYGRGDRTLKRAVTSQKCLRTGDIENVGRTPGHHTFFEMLGNFSFGDYFKEEAIVWAWEFLLEEMGIAPDELYVSIYKDDEEAYAVWRKSVGLGDERIFRYDEDENYWPANVRAEGPDGPCGPCSEIFFDLGEAAGCRRAECHPNCECGRFVEIWNLVFQQFDRQPDGSLRDLPMCNIDTGMGLERMARVTQGVSTNFDTDAFRPLLDEICSICGRPCESGTAAAALMRRIADHARAVAFCVADGVIPSNEERGYVVRRLLRRAVRDAVQLGVEEPFMIRLLEPVITAFGGAYPELAQSKEHIATVVRKEEESFRKTVKRGSFVLEEHVAALKRNRASVLRGKEVFDLYQTYGFPVEMTESILKEQGMTADMQGFLHNMKKHQELSKETGTFQDAVFMGGPLSALQESCEPTEFVGYQTLENEAKLVGIIVEEELVESVAEGQTAGLVLERTCAYGEAGGQVGDSGVILNMDESAQFAFDTVRREKGYFVHAGRMGKGEIRAGDDVLCRVDKGRRMAIARNHTATHLLHHALRKVLGEHATQSGSHVSAERLRFDFSNPTELSPEQLRQVEDIVNEKIMADEPVTSTRMSRSEAKEAGAVALFSEKYADIVRVISIGDYSRELCGGTHCRSTGTVGLLRIISESSVAGGVRRIEAVTGHGVLDRLRDKEATVQRLCDILRTQESDLAKNAEQLLHQIRSLQKEIQNQQQQAVKMMASGSLLDQAENIGGVSVVVAKLAGGGAALRSAADVLRKNRRESACVLASDEDGRAALVVGLSADLVERGLSAAEIVREIAQVVGGGGGGRDDLAQAGGSDVSKIDEALEKAKELLTQKLS